MNLPKNTPSHAPRVYYNGLEAPVADPVPKRSASARMRPSFGSFFGPPRRVGRDVAEARYAARCSTAHRDPSRWSTRPSPGGLACAGDLPMKLERSVRNLLINAVQVLILGPPSESSIDLLRGRRLPP